MPNLRVIIFDVEHGSCAFIKSPTGLTMFIDCGRSEEFSPVEYVAANELRDTVPFRGYSLTRLVISHPHDDHIEDIETLTSKLEPFYLKSQNYDWEEVKAEESDEYENLDLYAEWKESYVPSKEARPDWGVDVTYFYLTPEEAKKLDEAKYVNNSSIVVLVTHKGTKFTDKFLFGGDMEEAGGQHCSTRMQGSEKP